MCAAWAQRRREAPPTLLGGRFGDCDNFNFDSLDFTGNIFNMFGSAASGSGSGGGVGSGGMFAAAPPTGKGKLEARLLALLMQAGVDDALLDKIGESGMNTVALYANMASDEDRFKVVIAMDEIGVKGDSFNGMLSQSKLIGIWRTLRTSAEIEDKAAANRAQLALPPVVTTKDIKGLTKIFQATAEGYEVEKHECPSKDYFAKKCAQIESSFEAEHLTQVTNSHCDAPEAEIPDGQLAGFDMVQKTFRISNKEVRVSMPRDPEILQARFKTMRLCWTYLKLKYPRKRGTPHRHDQALRRLRQVALRETRLGQRNSGPRRETDRHAFDRPRAGVRQRRESTGDRQHELRDGHQVSLRRSDGPRADSPGPFLRGHPVRHETAHGDSTGSGSQPPGGRRPDGPQGHHLEDERGPRFVERRAEQGQEAPFESSEGSQEGSSRASRCGSRPKSRRRGASSARRRV